MTSISVLRAVFFGTADTPYRTKLSEGRIQTTLPLTKKGIIPNKPPTSPFYQVGLSAAILRAKDLIGPDNLSLIDIESVNCEGQNLGADFELPNAFYEALGKVNNEIEEATGFDPDKTLELPELLAFRKPTNESKPKETNVTNTTQITETHLKDLGIDVESLAEKGLTIEVINSKKITLEQLQEIAFQ